jgi:small conductance mechanosensitive channel
MTFEELVKMIPDSVWEQAPVYGMKLFGALVLLIIGKILIGIVTRFASAAFTKSKKINDLLEKFLTNITNKVLWAILWLMVASQLGFEVAPFIAGLGVTGFIIGFAFQDTLSNFAAGLMLLANEPFQKNELVEIGGQLGTVLELNIMATSLATPDNRKIMMPNSKVWGSAIINFSSLGTRRVDLTIGVSYKADIDKTQEVIRKVLESNEKVLKDPSYTIEVVEMADSSVNLVVRPWSLSADYWDVYFSVSKEVKIALDANNIEIPFPQRVVHMVSA